MSGAVSGHKSFRGYAWATASIVLISIAQLLMKWGMGQLPPPLPLLPPLSAVGFPELLEMLPPYRIPLLCIAAGVLCYAFSLACWMCVLHFLPLNRAYPLLSVSYVLVCLAAVVLPWFGETLTPAKTLGVLLILLGIWLIHAAPEKRE